MFTSSFAIQKANAIHHSAGTIFKIKRNGGVFVFISSNCQQWKRTFFIDQRREQTFSTSWSFHLFRIPGESARYPTQTADATSENPAPIEHNEHLVKSLWWSHGGFDVQRANVLPVLLQQRHQKVGRQMDVLDQFVEGHVNVADGNRQAQHLQTSDNEMVNECSQKQRLRLARGHTVSGTYLLHLEFDGGLDLVDFGDHRFVVLQQTRKLAGFVQAWAQQTWDLFDQRFGGQEGVVFFGQLLHQFLVFVQLFQVVGVHVWDLEGLSLVAMLLIAQDAHLHFWPWDVLQSVRYGGKGGGGGRMSKGSRVGRISLGRAASMGVRVL